MKKIAIVLLVSLGLSACVGIKNDNNDVSIRIASYNMAFCRNTDDFVKTWQPRKEYLMKVLRDYDFDICGAQEPYAFQIKYLQQQAPEYAYVETFVANETPEIFAKRKPNAVNNKYVLPNMNNPIWYKKAMFDVLDSGKFWFSNTPDVQSGGWEYNRSDKERHCTWAKFKHKPSGKEFFVFNLHLICHNHQKNHPDSIKIAKLLLKKVNEIAKDKTVFVMGDFNADDEHICLNILNNSDVLKNSRLISKQKELESNTSFISFAPAENRYHAIIDHILVSKDVKVGKFALKNPIYNGVYPSDHLPIYIDAKF